MIYANDNPGPGTYNIKQNIAKKCKNKKYKGFGTLKNRF